MVSVKQRHSGFVNKPRFARLGRGSRHWVVFLPFVIGLLSLIWLAWRSGTKPSRAAYPCQRVAAAHGSIWLATYFVPAVVVARRTWHWKKLCLALLSVTMLGLLAYTVGSQGGLSPSLASQPQTVQLDLTERVAIGSPASDIFAVNGTNGNDGGLLSLIGLMGARGMPFYRSSSLPGDRGPDGLIAHDDTVIIKVNSQWDERGGTNTDLLKALIDIITRHPDGFIGEIVVADNGQGQYGLNGMGGSLNYSRNNAEDIAQSVQKVVDSFAQSYHVSTYLWDTITTRKVQEYGEGDMEDGYILKSSADPETGIITSYPKFKTRFGTYISFKNGVWDAQTGSYDSASLKVINVPVLKSHAIYGVTGSVKHYMGVGSDKLTAQAGARMHNTVGAGGMGTEMVETRFPTLNIIDAIWVNANPGRGPGTSYSAATKTGTIAASTDPVALDYWAAKNILVPAAKKTGNSNTDSMDPDKTQARAFGHWLRLTMQEIQAAGYQATADEASMNVYVSPLNQDAVSLTPTSTDVAATAAPAAASSSFPPARSPSRDQASESGAFLGWVSIVVRVVIPLIVAGVIMGVVSYQMRKKR